MSVTRGAFLKQLGNSLPGMVFGTGAAAAQKLFNKVAAVTGDPVGSSPSAPSAAAQAAKPAPAEFIHTGPSTKNHIALTFDDGPTPGVTNRILDELQRRGLHATFFMIGQRIAAAPDLARRVLAEGHDVANHTFTHPKLSELPPVRVREEIRKTQDVMSDILNHRPVWFRPPYGALRPDQVPMVHEHGMRVVMWSVDPSDWSQPGEDKIIGTILRDAKAGGVIVCHDMHAQTANALPRVLDGLLERGLTSVTMSTLMVG